MMGHFWDKNYGSNFNNNEIIIKLDFDTLCWDICYMEIIIIKTDYKNFMLSCPRSRSKANQVKCFGIFTTRTPHRNSVIPTWTPVGIVIVSYNTDYCKLSGLQKYCSLVKCNVAQSLFHEEILSQSESSDTSDNQ